MKFINYSLLALVIISFVSVCLFSMPVKKTGYAQASAENDARSGHIEIGEPNKKAPATIARESNYGCEEGFRDPYEPKEKIHHGTAPAAKEEAAYATSRHPFGQTPECCLNQRYYYETAITTVKPNENGDNLECNLAQPQTFHLMQEAVILNRFFFPIYPPPREAILQTFIKRE